MRLSGIQKDVLFLLYALKLKGKQEPINSMSILAMINGSRNSFIADKNFRISCHKLTEHGLLEYERGQGQRLLWKLTKQGSDHAAVIYNNIINNLAISP